MSDDYCDKSIAAALEKLIWKIYDNGNGLLSYGDVVQILDVLEQGDE